MKKTFESLSEGTLFQFALDATKVIYRKVQNQKVPIERLTGRWIDQVVTIQ